MRLRIELASSGQAYGFDEIEARDTVGQQTLNSKGNQRHSHPVKLLVIFNVIEIKNKSWKITVTLSFTSSWRQKFRTPNDTKEAGGPGGPGTAFETKLLWDLTLRTTLLSSFAQSQLLVCHCLWLSQHETSMVKVALVSRINVRGFSVPSRPTYQKPIRRFVRRCCLHVNHDVNHVFQ